MNSQKYQRGQYLVVAAVVLLAMIPLFAGLAILFIPSPGYSTPQKLGTLEDVRVRVHSGFLAPPDTATLVLTNGTHTQVIGDGPTTWKKGTKVTRVDPVSSGFAAVIHPLHPLVCVEGGGCARALTRQ